VQRSDDFWIWRAQLFTTLTTGIYFDLKQKKCQLLLLVWIKFDCLLVLGIAYGSGQMACHGYAEQRMQKRKIIMTRKFISEIHGSWVILFFFLAQSGGVFYLLWPFFRHFRGHLHEPSSVHAQVCRLGPNNRSYVRPILNKQPGVLLFAFPGVRQSGAYIYTHIYIYR